MQTGICEVCGLSKAVKRKRKTGKLMCDACSEKLRLASLGRRECSLCKEIRLVYTYRAGQPVCRRCYRTRVNIEACSECAKVREVVRRLEDGKALCGTCAQKRIKHRCAVCGRTDKPTPYRTREREPLCQRCYNSTFRKQVHCQHHWNIEPPNGPTSRGVCEHCGAEAEFRNSIDYSAFRSGERLKEEVFLER